MTKSILPHSDAIVVDLGPWSDRIVVPNLAEVPQSARRTIQAVHAGLVAHYRLLQLYERILSDHIDEKTAASFIVQAEAIRRSAWKDYQAATGRAINRKHDNWPGRDTFLDAADRVRLEIIDLIETKTRDAGKRWDAERNERAQRYQREQAERERRANQQRTARLNERRAMRTQRRSQGLSSLPGKRQAPVEGDRLARQRARVDAASDDAARLDALKLFRQAALDIGDTEQAGWAKTEMKHLRARGQDAASPAG